MINFDLTQYLNPVFIETGTGKGVGVKKAIEAGFERIISIEISEELYLRASDTFRDEIMSGLVEIRFGDSVELLPFILDEIDVATTFWLDAHGEECPLYEELEAIRKHKVKNHIIMIDDRRLFKDNGNIEGWGQSITESRIIDTLKEINGRYHIAYENGTQDEDVIIASVPCILCKKITRDGSFCNECYMKDKAKGIFD